MNKQSYPNPHPLPLGLALSAHFPFFQQTGSHEDEESEVYKFKL